MTNKDFNYCKKKNNLALISKVEWSISRKIHIKVLIRKMDSKRNRVWAAL